jgi:hypothetical protein
MTSPEELREALARASSPTERRLHFVALLIREAAWKDREAIVVGGSAIEIYTSGRYTTGDIDLVLTAPSRPDRILRSWGFRERGRLRFHDELGIVLDFVKPPYTGDLDRCQILTTPYGPVRIAAVEDLLVKRLASAKHWRQPRDLEHAKILAALYRDRIAWDYVEEQAARYDVGDVLADLKAAVARA